MRAARKTFVVCCVITVLSFIGLAGLYKEVDIFIHQKITDTVWIYDYNARNFYQGLWGNAFTGAIVSVFTTYVPYKQAKHELEFKLKANEQMMVLHFTSIASPLYNVNLLHPLFASNNHAAIQRFNHAISDTKMRYDNMIEASNDYCPFFLTKKPKNLIEGKEFLQDLWVEICGVEDSLLIYTDEKDLKNVIDTTREKVNARKQKLDKVADSIKDY